MNGDRYGTHRVIGEPGLLPQPARRLDNRMDIRDNEILIDVDTLNIDSASFTQISGTCGGDPDRIAEAILAIVGERGKMQNPVTGSGGMLIGRVAAVGPALADRGLKPRDPVATLVSLSLTPLRINRIKAVRTETDQVDIEGQAILFESGLYAVLPEDIPRNLALAVLDVAGAPAQTARLVRPGDRVAVIGAGGKSGLLCLHAARKAAGPEGRVAAVSLSDRDVAMIRRIGAADVVVQADATDAVALLDAFTEAAGGPADVVVNTVNVPNTELSSVLLCRERGTVYFFSMATDFAKAALGAEGVGKDVTMIIGNGYAEGHAELALDILRESEGIRELYEELYAPEEGGRT